MVKYYGRAKTITGSINTNQSGLNMSGTASSVGHSNSVQRYINRRVDSLAGVCGIPKQNGGSWRQSLKNKHPYCRQKASKCLAAAGGVGRGYHSYYKTLKSGEKGCGATGDAVADVTAVDDVAVMHDKDGDKLYAVGGMDGTHTTVNSVERFDPSTRKWTETHMTTARAGLGVAVMHDKDGDKLYAVGGENNASTDPALNTVEWRDPKTGGWSMLGKGMTIARAGLGVAVMGSKLYAVGGFNGSVLNSVERFDPSTGKWSAVAAMTTARRYLDVAVMHDKDGDKLYAVGGTQHQNPARHDGLALNSVECFDPLKGNWVPGKPMTTARAGLGVAVMGSKLYAVGGMDEYGMTLNSVECFDPLKGNWVPGKPMRQVRKYHSVAVMGSKLYAFGGMDENGMALNSVECFDPSTKTPAWEMKNITLPKNMSNFGVSVLKVPVGLD